MHMKTPATVNLVLFAWALATLVGCSPTPRGSFAPRVVYQSADLIITQISDNAFEHTSFLQTQDFGNVPCNGLIVRHGKEAVIFDTPTTDKSSEELIAWLHERYQLNITAIVPTHFHNDCLAGLQAFHHQKIPSYALAKTIDLAKANNYPVPQNSFTDSLRLPVGSQHVVARFWGEGHTADNIIAYFPAEDVMFGGCLIKEVNATKGYLGDANLAEWSRTVERIRQHYPHVRMVVPGHGQYGDNELLDYTIQLFRNP